LIYALYGLYFSSVSNTFVFATGAQVVRSNLEAVWYGVLRVLALCFKMADNDGESNENDQKIYDYPGQFTSECWKVFGFYKTKPGPPSKQTLDMNYAVCRLCKKKYVNKGKFVPVFFVPTSVSRELSPNVIVNYRLKSICPVFKGKE
jgi:hypothetical protein